MNVPRNNSMGMQVYRELVEREAKSNMQWALLCAAVSNIQRASTPLHYSLALHLAFVWRSGLHCQHSAASIGTMVTFLVVRQHAHVHCLSSGRLDGSYGPEGRGKVTREQMFNLGTFEKLGNMPMPLEMQLARLKEDRAQLHDQAHATERRSALLLRVTSDPAQSFVRACSRCSPLSLLPPLALCSYAAGLSRTPRSPHL